MLYCIIQTVKKIPSVKRCCSIKMVYHMFGVIMSECLGLAFLSFFTLAWHGLENSSFEYPQLM